MNQILDRLWLGDMDDGLVAHECPMPKIGAILALNERAYQTPLAYFHVSMPDEVFLPGHIWQSRVETLAQLQESLVTTLVHCRLGVSRSPALVAAYLAHIGMMPDVTKALGYVMGRRSVVKVHDATWAGVTSWWSQR